MEVVIFFVQPQTNPPPMSSHISGFSNETSFAFEFQAVLGIYKNKLKVGWGIVACPVIQAIGRPDLEDFLRTRSPGEVIVGLLSVRTSSEITLVSILGQCDL